MGENTAIRSFLISLLQILVLALGVFIIYELNQPIKNVRAIIQLHGNQKLSKNEVLEEIDKLELDGKSFLEINPLKIRSKLKRHPLIEDIKIRRFLYPKPTVKAYLTEALAWGSYEDQIINSHGYVIARMNDKALSWKIKKHFIEVKGDLVKIKSYLLLNQDKLILLRNIAKSIEEATGETVKSIYGNRDENFSINTFDHKYKLGLLNNQIEDRVKRIELIVDKIAILNEELDYVDLSLATPEIILGKKDRKPSPIKD